MVTASREVIRVLLVEDDEEDYLITVDMLADHEHVQFVVDWCSTYRDALVVIREQRHDVYLIDYRLGERTGLELIREVFTSPASGPVIMLTGQATYEIDVEASALGVTAFLAKQRLDPVTLERSIRYAINHRRAERYALAVQAANDGIWDWDLQIDRIYFSPRWCALLGLPEKALDADPAAFFDLVDPADLHRLRGAIQDHLEGRSPHLECEHRMRHADGSWRWVMTRGLAMRGPDGIPIRMGGSLSDLTDRQLAQLRLEHEALHDTLTGLPNRALFLNRVTQFLQRSSREAATTCAVLFLDLDGFKLVNDSLSHAVGDHLLIALADRIDRAVRPGDTVARLGGDEFTVLLEDVSGADEATLIADRILGALAEAFDIDGNELFIGASIGVALSAPGLAPMELMRNADIAMYSAKQRGRGGSVVFDKSMHRRIVDRITHETELREAIESSLLRVHYQPIIDLGNGSIRGVEALARWPDGWSPVAPVEFISIAEETGMIGDLGHYVLRSALDTFGGWRREGLVEDDASISVNLSVRQLNDPSLAEQVHAAIGSAGLPHQTLKLEISETTLMHDMQRAQHVFSKVCGTGVGLLLDDFGTGYSSLTALHRFPFDALKIDRSFVARVPERDGDGETIVRSIIALAHSLGLPVIAEGIETAAQLKRLRALGCDYGQGYLFSLVQSANDMRNLLRSWRPAEVVERAAAI